MNTAATFSSGFVTCLAAVSIACGGGGEELIASDPLPTTCAARMVANRAIVLCEDFGVSADGKEFGPAPDADAPVDPDDAYLNSDVREEA